jgi:hypothetical protein
MECKEIKYAGHRNNSFKGTFEILVRFSLSAGGKMGGLWNRTCGRIHDFYEKGDDKH